jgi:hypothetical protein
MADTNTGDVSNAIQKFWSPTFMDQLRQTNILVSQVNRDYDGEIKKPGDTVKVLQVNKPTGQTLTRDGTGGEVVFVPETMSISYVDVVANRRFVASYEIDDTVDLQTMLDPFSPNSVKIRTALLDAVNTQINTYLYALLTGGGHTGSTTTMTATVMAAARKYAGQKNWDKTKPWYGNLSPEYWADCLVDTKLTSSDFVAAGMVENAMSGGVKRFGFNLFEDSSLTNKAVFFHPDALIFAMQYEPRFKLSDQHAQKRFGYVLSCDILGGGVLGINGTDKYTDVTVAV